MGIPSQPALSPVVDICWRVRLLGGVDLDDGAQRIERLPSRAVTALLARLALWPQRLHAREELVELLWPGVDLAVGRNRLRQALSTLKSLLEPAGHPAVLLASRLGVRVVPGALSCDARDFESLLQTRREDDARSLYRGELMPGFYDTWVDDERLRLAALHERVERGDGPETPRTAASPNPASAAPSSARPFLPAYLTRYFGADAQAAQLRGQVLAQRLVTLLGPGGGGKTRLAVELVRSLRDTPDFAHPGDPGRRFPSFDLVAFVPLVACTDGAQMLAAIGAALRLPSAGADSVERLVAALADVPTLLVLDNFEQIVETAAPIVGELLSRLPALHLLITSRRALGLDGEREFALAPLGLPDSQAALAETAMNPAVALFVDRARAVRADFHLGARNAAAVAGLVRALEGMPLAIELAACRVRAFSPQEMLALLRSGTAGQGSAALDLLSRSGPRSGLDPRHASMRRVIEWSWQQLTPAQQRLLQCLTVFEGSFDAAAVAAAHRTASVDEASRQLDDLAAHSLLRPLPAGNTSQRFALQEPIREFAAESVAAPQARRWRQRLRDWLAAWATAAGGTLLPAQVDAELPNIYAALRNATADGAPLDAWHIALALRAHWDTDGMPAAPVADLEAALAAIESLPAADTRLGLRSQAHDLLAYLCFEGGAFESAGAHADAALRYAGDDASLRARALVRIAWVRLAGYRGGVDQEPALREALALAEGCADLEAQARALHQLAVIESVHRHDPVAAERLLARSQALWQRLGDRPKVYARLRSRAQCWFALGRRAEALASFEACEAAALEQGDWVGLIDCTLTRGNALAAMRQWPAAAAALARCAAVSWERHHVHGLAYALWNQARVLARLRRPDDAARLMAFAEHFWVTRIGPASGHDSRYQRRVRGLVQKQLGRARTEALWVEGRLMSLPQAVAIASALPP